MWTISETTARLACGFEGIFHILLASKMENQRAAKLFGDWPNNFVAESAITSYEVLGCSRILFLCYS